LSDYARVSGFVSGVVQGVGFRFFVQRRASRYGLTGWVRNLPDDRVEFVAEGERSMLEQLLKDIKIGPPSAHVSDIKITWDKYSAEFKEFKIRL